MAMKKTCTHGAGLALLLCAGLGVSGCTGHGNYTQAHKDQAEQRVAQMKSATEWDMAHQQFLAGDLKKALMSIDRSISLNDGVAKSHVLRARVLIEMGSLEPAVTAVDKAIELSPDNTEAHYYRGIIFERFGQEEKALACFMRASETDVTDPQYPLAAAEMLMSLRRLDEAEELLNGGAARFEHNAGIRQTLGHIAMIRGDYSRAVQLFNEACRLAAEDSSLQEDLARAQIAAKRFAEAESTLAWLVNQGTSKNRRDLVQLRARCLIEIDRPVEARDMLLQLTADERGANDPELWSDLGTVSVMLSDRMQLRRSAQRLISISPRQADGHVLLALLHRLNGDPEAALATVRRARQFPGAAAPMLEGLLCEQLGRTAEARQAYALASEREQAGHSGFNLPGAGAGNAVAEVRDVD